jgi:hypothetical protein
LIEQLRSSVITILTRKIYKSQINSIKGVKGLDWLIEANIALWSYIMPLLGVFSLVRFKKGGFYGSEGTYISNKMALLLLLVEALISYFVLSEMIRVLVESLCASNPIMGYILIMIAPFVIWKFYIKKQRRW